MLATVVALVAVGCATPKPILYPNAHLQTVGSEAAGRDIGECRQLAETAGARDTPEAGQVAGAAAVGAGLGAASGAVGGAIVGAAGSGAGIGAVVGGLGGVLGAVFRRPGPSPAYVGFVDRCLRERGYEPTGWQ